MSLTFERLTVLVLLLDRPHLEVQPVVEYVRVRTHLGERPDRLAFGGRHRVRVVGGRVGALARLALPLLVNEGDGGEVVARVRRRHEAVYDGEVGQDVLGGLLHLAQAELDVLHRRRLAVLFRVYVVHFLREQNNNWKKNYLALPIFDRCRVSQRITCVIFDR